VNRSFGLLEQDMDGYLGVDWGTHSSKWCYQDSGGRIEVGEIWDSRVWRLGDCLAMFPLSRRFSGDHGGVSGLKGKLIRDPGQPFWTGERSDIEATLGEAVVFSLATLLLDATTRLEAKGINAHVLEKLKIRFSHPHWTTPEKITALQAYRDAAVVALATLGSSSKGAFRSDEAGIQASLSDLRTLIDSRKAQATKLEKFPRVYEYKAYRRCASGTNDGIDWEFVFESAAAGFPYIAQAEPDLFSGDTPDSLGEGKFRKILVVDIGAGSTDAGYMLRTIRPDPSTKKPIEPMLIWFPAAVASEMAGNWLTDQIYDHWNQEGRRGTRLEAEDYKTSGTTEWYGRPYVVRWSEEIAKHVSRYMQDVRDTIRLPHKPYLELVITGGSSAVAPVKTALVEHVKEALLRREIGMGVVEGTNVIQPSFGAVLGGGYSDTQQAQLAVCLGASDPRMVKLTHYDSL
jgi:hypothetical protein